MASEVVSEIADRRFVAEVPGLPGVMAYGETAAQAQMRAAIIALRAMLREDGAEASACDPAMAPAVRLDPRVIWRAAGVDRCVAVRTAAWLAAAWLTTAAGCPLSDPCATASLATGSGP
jgi:predicted RNase H-like HicB family nuclease